MNLLTILSIGILFTGCVKAKMHQEIKVTSSRIEKENLAEECKAINAVGDIQKLFSVIHKDTRYVLKLLDSKKPELNTELVQEVASRVKENSDLVMTLAQDEWNSPLLLSEIRWELKTSKKALVKKVFFRGEERDDLINLVGLEQSGNSLEVRYQNEATLLEYCQLNQTLVILVEVQNKLFNLYVGEQ